jgi:Fe-S oxidoreductase
MLWPDTFTNHFAPSIGVAATEVLEEAGYRVTIPPRTLCCGRPLYDYGMLDLAKRQLRQILDTLRDDIEAGVPLIGLEPSCIATFRDELHGMFPDDPVARRLEEQTYSLAEFLCERAPDYEPPRMERKAILHGHCHQKALWGVDRDRALLGRMGMDVEVPDTGCCGMAGSFGFEADKFDVSIAVGERVLLPAVRTAGRDTVVVADGFSCREQVIQTTGRRPLHLAEVLYLARAR